MDSKHRGKTYHGKPCLHGHGTLRYASTSHCVVCRAEWQRRDLKDPAKRARRTKRTAEWRARNPGRAQELDRAYYWRDPEKYRGKTLRWMRENPEKVNALIAKRTADKLRRTPKWADMRAIEAVYEAAARMRSETGIGYDVDHVIPLRGRLVSGLHVAENLQILERSANARKGNRFVID